jgi:hypothetical protein
MRKRRVRAELVRLIGGAMLWLGLVAAADAKSVVRIPNGAPRVIVISSSLGAEPSRLARNARDIVERALVENARESATVITNDKHRALALRFERGRSDDPRESVWASAEAALKAYDNAELGEARALLTSIAPSLIDRPYVTRGDPKRVSLRRRALLCLALIHLANRDTTAATKTLRQLIQIDPHYEPRPGEYPSRFINQIARLRSDALAAMMRVNVEPVSAATGYLVNGVPVLAQAGAQQILLPAGVAWIQWRHENAIGPLARIEGKADEALTVRPDPARERRVIAVDDRLHLVFPTRADEDAGEREAAMELAAAAGANATLVVRSDGALRWVTATREARGKLEFPPRAAEAAKEIARLVSPPVSLATKMGGMPKPRTRFRVWKWMTAGVGLATTAVGVTFALLAAASQREYNETPQTLSNVTTLRDLESTGETQSQIATGAFIAGGVVMAVAALLFALDKPVAVVIDTPRSSRLPISSFAIGLRWSLR